MTKMTYAQALAIAIKAVADNSEAVERLTALKDQIEKKNATKPKKPNKTQAENQELRDRILTVLKGLNDPITCAELADLMKVDKPKLTGNLNMMVKAGTVETIKEIVGKDGKVKKSSVNLYKVA